MTEPKQPITLSSAFGRAVHRLHNLSPDQGNVMTEPLTAEKITELRVNVERVKSGKAEQRSLFGLLEHDTLAALIAAAEENAKLRAEVDDMQCAFTEQTNVWRMERTAYYEMKQRTEAAERRIVALKAELAETKAVIEHDDMIQFSNFHETVKQHNDQLQSQLSAALASVEALKAKDRYGFDMQGPDIGVDWTGKNGFACECRWASSHHGNICPEHGKAGVPVVTPSVEAARQEERERVRELLLNLAELVKGKVEDE